MGARGLRSGLETVVASPAATLAATVAALLLLVGCGAALAPAAAPADGSPGGSPAEGSAPGRGGLPSTLRVGLVPNQAPERQQARFAPFAEALEAQLGTDVELYVATSYAGVVTALAADRVDLAYLGGLTYAQAEQQVPLTPLVTDVDAETGSSRYLSALVVPADSAARSAGDLVRAGARVALGDPASTSGSLYPRVMLTDAGARCSSVELTSCPPLGEVAFTGGHDAAALAVVGGRADAAGLELRLLRRFEREGRLPAGALRVLETREVEGYPWVGRTALGAGALSAVRDFFTGLDPDDPGDAALLDLLGARRYVPVGAADYAEVRAQARRLGLLR